MIRKITLLSLGIFILSFNNNMFAGLKELENKVEEILASNITPQEKQAQISNLTQQLKNYKIGLKDIIEYKRIIKNKIRGFRFRA